MTSILLCWEEKARKVRLEGQLVEHGDLLSVWKQAQEGLLGGFERELTTPNTLLISTS
jgi:hypothetical protein